MTLRSFFAAIALSFLWSGNAFGEIRCTVTVAVSPQVELVSSIAKAQALLFGNQDNSVNMIIRPHTLNPGGRTAVRSGQGYASTALSISPYAGSTTYNAVVTCIAEQMGFELDRQTQSASATTPATLPDYKDIEPRNCTPIWDAEGMTWIDPECDTPILLDLGGRGYKLTSASDGVSFNIRDDGVARQIGWTAPDSEVAFLVRDRNGDGSIDTGAELFGNATPLASGRRAANGFVALAELDGNGDAVLDQEDAVWPSLWLWVDRNHNGISSPEELQAVQGSNIRWIGVAFEVVNRRDPWGNTFRFMSRFGMASGSGHGGTRLFYDVLLTR